MKFSRKKIRDMALHYGGIYGLSAACQLAPEDGGLLSLYMDKVLNLTYRETELPAYLCVALEKQWKDFKRIEP